MSDQINPLTPVDGDRVLSLCHAQGLHEVAVQSVLETESTNADAVALAQKGFTGYQVVVAGTQTAGRGRLDRQWTDQGADSLSFSLAVHVPQIVPAENWGWISLLAGMAVVNVVRAHGVDAKTKWPNDVIVEEAAQAGESEAAGQPYLKLAGILSEAVDGYAIVGIGINLSAPREVLPVPTATSLAAEGGTDLSREAILAEIVVEFDRLWLDWTDRYGEATGGLDASYADTSATIGSQIRALGVGGEESSTSIEGTATAVDAQGRLLISQQDGAEIAVSVGDIEHLQHPDS